MTGLEKMQNQILEEARKKAEEILEQAKQEAEQIKKDARVKGQEESTRILEKSRAEVKKHGRTVGLFLCPSEKAGAS